MKNIKICAVLLVSLLLAACGQEVRTVEWFNAHPDEAEKTYSECISSNDQSEDCRNAETSKKHTDFRKQQKNAPEPSF